VFARERCRSLSPRETIAFRYARLAASNLFRLGITNLIVCAVRKWDTKVLTTIAITAVGRCRFVVARAPSIQPIAIGADVPVVFAPLKKFCPVCKALFRCGPKTHLIRLSNFDVMDSARPSFLTTAHFARDL
jgi:hypothetical protein